MNTNESGRGNIVFRAYANSKVPEQPVRSQIMIRISDGYIIHYTIIHGLLCLHFGVFGTLCSVIVVLLGCFLYYLFFGWVGCFGPSLPAHVPKHLYAGEAHIHRH